MPALQTYPRSRRRMKRGTSGVGAASRFCRRCTRCCGSISQEAASLGSADCGAVTPTFGKVPRAKRHSTAATSTPAWLLPASTSARYRRAGGTLQYRMLDAHAIPYPCSPPLPRQSGYNLQRIAMSLTRMHATGTCLAATMPSFTAPDQVSRRLPICPMLGADWMAARCCSTSPKLRCVRIKQEVRRWLPKPGSA